MGMQKRLIQHSQNPFILAGLRIYNHDSDGDLLVWEPKKIELIRFDKKSMNGYGQSVDVMLFLIKNPDCIPECFKGKKVFFVKTTFLDGKKVEVFPFIHSDNGKWEVDTFPISGPWFREDVILSIKT